MGTDYHIWMTGSNPSGLRFHVLNAADDEAIRLNIWYKNPQRKDVYKVGYLIFVVVIVVVVVVVVYIVYFLVIYEVNSVDKIPIHECDTKSCFFCSYRMASSSRRKTRVT